MRRPSFSIVLPVSGALRATPSNAPRAVVCPPAAACGAGGDRGRAALGRRDAIGVGAVAPGPPGRQHLLAPDDGVLRAVGHVPLRELRLQRDVVAVGDPGAHTHDQAGRRLPWRCPGPELHVHRERQAGDRVHRRHPSPERHAAPAVQGADRDVGHTRGVPVKALCAAAVGAHGHVVFGVCAGPCVRHVATGQRAVPRKPRGDQGSVDARAPVRAERQ